MRKFGKAFASLPTQCMKSLFTAATLTALMVPFAAYAGEPETIGEVLNVMTGIVLLAVPFAFVLLAFFWNLSHLLFNLNDAEKKKQAKARMIWSVIALFIVFSLAGIIAVLQNTLFGETSIESLENP